MKESEDKWLLNKKTFQLTNGRTVTIEIRNPFDADPRGYLIADYNEESKNHRWIEYIFFSITKDDSLENYNSLLNTANEYFINFTREKALEWYLKNVLNQLQNITN